MRNRADFRSLARACRLHGCALIRSSVARGLLAAAVAAGCGSGGGDTRFNPPTEPTPTVATPTPASPTPAPTPTPAALAGDLDLRFGESGIATIAALEGFYAFAVATQADGAIVVAARSSSSRVSAGVVRLTADGALDTGFGSDGITTDVLAGEDGRPLAIAVERDGKILVAGEKPAPDGQTLPIVVRLGLDGAPDFAFGKRGVVFPRAGLEGGSVTAVTVQADGKIVAAGRVVRVPPGRGPLYTLWRFEEDGAPDEGFGTRGRVAQVVRASADTAVGAPDIVAAAPDGSLLTMTGSSPFGFNLHALVRFTGDGSLDTAFGDGGVVAGFADFREYLPPSLAVRPDGRIVTVLRHANLSGLTADGRPDLAFGDAGSVVTGAEHGGRLVLDRAERVILPAAARNDHVFSLCRYTAAGDPDQDFGEAGRARTIFSTARTVPVAAVQPTRGIIVAGPEPNGGRTIAVARYLSEARRP